MSLKYTCPSCGTPLGYEGLCWKCKCEQERQAALACIAYIQQLVSEGEFELMQEESTCPLEKVKTEDGWADEIMAHMIRCKHCGQIFTCVVNTWRGSGHFKKGKG